MSSSLQVGQPLPTNIANLGLLDQSGFEVTIDSLLGQAPTLIILLRHFGCIACSEQVNQWLPHLKTLAENNMHFCFIGNGLPQYIAGFVERHQLSDKPVTILTNPTLSLYNAAGMIRSISSNLRPSSVKNALRAFTHGNRQTTIEGNPNQQGGILIFDANKNLVFIHREKTLGDHLSVMDVITVLENARD